MVWDEKTRTLWSIEDLNPVYNGRAIQLNIPVGRSTPRKTVSKASVSTPSPKPKRKASAYSKRYGAAFRKVAKKFKKKNGSWKTNGFKNAQKAAHKLAKR
jgi:hypothetical protein